MANVQISSRLISRNDLAANWTTKNPVLLKGELGIEIDTNLIKIGNGTATWTELPYVNESAPAETTYHATPTEGQSDLEAIAAVVGLAGAVHFIGVKESLPTSGNNGDICIVGNKEYVYSTSDSQWHELGDETIYAVKGQIKDADIAADAAIAQSKIAGLTNALNAKANSADLGTMASETAADYIKKTDAPGYADILTATVAGTTYETKADASAKLNDAKTHTTTELGKLNLTEVATGEGKIISKISQVNGKVSAETRDLVAADIPTIEQSQVNGLDTALAAKANDADLAAIAKSGNVNDLQQTEGDTLIIFGGTSVLVV